MVRPIATGIVDHVETGRCGSARAVGYNVAPMNVSPMPMTRAERALRAVLRVNGTITALAIVAVFIPRAWMAWAHQAMGMGAAPPEAIFEYLARTVSFLYFVHGTLCWVVSGDVRRFGPVITYVGVVELCFAGLVVWIDSSAGMPRYWTAVESTVVAAFSGTILLLRARARGLD
jgi:hypothetical protein